MRSLMKLCVYSAIVLLVGPGAFAQPAMNGIAVIVNDAIITRQEVNEYIRPSAQTLVSTIRDREAVEQRLSKLYEAGTEDLVNRQLILHDYKEAGYNYPETIIEDQIQERIKTQYRDRAQLMQDLHARLTTYENFRKQQKEEILIRLMRQVKIQQDVLISPQKILNYYHAHQTNYSVGEEVRLRLIVLNKPPSDSGAVKQRAEEIMRKINEGASFADMARSYSESPQAKDGGDSGWAQRDLAHPERNTLREELSNVAFSLKPGERSGVIDLPDSVWMLQVEERRAARVRPLSEVRDQIERELRIREAERQEEKWVKRLREKSFVRYF
jgi:peptidyl-prolyl cis-trans isomerase SurA